MKDELFVRQAAVLRQVISAYRDGALTLNALIQRIEGVSDIVDGEWKDAVFPIVLLLEQINASVLDERRSLTMEEKASVRNSLLEIEALICRFEAG